MLSEPLRVLARDRPAAGPPVLELAFSNPHARVVEETGSTLVIHLPDFPGDPTASGTRVAVEFDTGVRTVEVSRSVYTSNEIYLVDEAADAPLVVTDHFLTAVRHCPPDRRQPDDDALVDHFLFRTIPAEKTYARGVTRVGHGRTVRWDARAARLHVVRREHAARPASVAFSDALRHLERSLKEVVDSVVDNAVDRTVVNLLSGGIDSTLLQTFLPHPSRSLAVAIDTPEFAPETARAVLASALTGSEHQVVRLRERGYVEALERLITATGLPPHHMQSVLFGELFRLQDGERRYLLMAQLADALFGLRALALPAAVLRRCGWRLPQLMAAVRLPRAWKPGRLGLVETWSSRVNQPVGSAQGLAARAATYTDFDFAERVFGTEQVARRLAKRLQYVLDVCPFLSADEAGLDAQLEAAHLVDYFCDDAVSIWRQAAMSHGAYIICPFTHIEVVRASLAFSRRERYWRGGEIKPALKALLRRRLPRYDTGLPKLSSGLPIERFVETGPLQHCTRLQAPAIWPGFEAAGGRAYPPWIAWSLFTLSAWRERMALGPATPPLTLSRSLA
jgi:asparagine synthase (glutamine-hydrolysing)